MKATRRRPRPMLRYADYTYKCSCALREALVVKGVGVVEPVAG
jgi:hypothetical protein